MHHHTGFSAWVTIDGKEVIEYDVETSEDQNTVTCWIYWIPSELGKRFVVHWKNSVYRHDTLGHVSMDGTWAAGQFIRHRMPSLPAATHCDGVSDGTSVKLFVFSSLELTDDDAFLGGSESLHQELGVIQLSITPVQITGASDKTPKSRSLSEMKVHERAKKAVTQQIMSAGQAEQLAKPKTYSSWKRTGPDLVKLCFKYRPLDVLQANGIAPLPPRLKRKASAESLRAPTPDEDLVDTKEEKNLREKLNEQEAKGIKKEKKPPVKREFEAGAVIDLTLPSKRVKRAEKRPFVSGEVIDLT
ncbi:hypothetical protein B0H17DRAFT_1103672 [Mycena rosella]|uniref:DUF7918 domain-containing protein n=1 Tax=Mycena rosella TaxID=1033263 RepID=A0AAD7CDC2_MYCRO|nr:hypothetical protein B0H17DRAFT_1103672 [Mycena rosella]